MVFVVCRMNLAPDDSGMDLLPITKAAIHNALHGRNPYLADYTSITTGPFFYLTLEWISYALFEIAGINLRWINLFCWLGIIVIFERSAMKAVDRSLARAAFYPVMAAFPVFQAMVSPAPPLSLATVYLLAALTRGYERLAAFILGCLLAISQVMLALAGLIAVY